MKNWSTYLRQLHGGKNDETQLNSIIAYLKITHNIPAHKIKKDHFLLFDIWDYSVIDIVDCVTDQMMVQKPLVRRPDILIMDNDKKVKLIIELDGSVHHSASGAKKTFKRNLDYDYSQIPYIVIDIMDLQLVKKNWFEFLDEELKKKL